MVLPISMRESDHAVRNVFYLLSCRAASQLSSCATGRRGRSILINHPDCTDGSRSDKKRLVAWFAWRTLRVHAGTGHVRIGLKEAGSVGIAHEAADQLVDAVGRFVDFAKGVVGGFFEALAVEQSGGELDGVEIVADVVAEARQGHGIAFRDGLGVVALAG